MPAIAAEEGSGTVRTAISQGSVPPIEGLKVCQRSFPPGGLA